MNRHNPPPGVARTNRRSHASSSKESDRSLLAPPEVSCEGPRPISVGEDAARRTVRDAELPAPSVGPGRLADEYTRAHGRKVSEVMTADPVTARLGREQWDVISPAGKLVARWRLPVKTTLMALGSGVLYTVRTDEDDLRYAQQVVLPK